MKEVIIDEISIQNEAKDEIGRKLTEEELNQVCEVMYADDAEPPLWQIIRKAIKYVVEQDEE